MSLIKQKKKIWLFASIIAVLGITTYLLWYFGVFEPTSKEIIAYRAVPENAAIIINIPDVFKSQKRLTGKKFEEEIGKLPLVDEMFHDLNLFKTLLDTQKVNLSSLQIVAASQMVKAGNIDWLYIIPFEKNNLLIEQLRSDSSFVATNVGTNGFLWQVNSEEKYVLSVLKSVILISKTTLSVENGLSAWNDKQHIEEPSLSELQELVGKNGDASIYINMELSAALLAILSEFEVQEEIKSLSMIANSIGFEIKLEDDHLKINGYTIPNKDNQFFEALQEQQLPKDMLLADVLPDNTAILLHAGLSDIQDFYTKMNQDKKPDFEQYFLPWIGDELAYVITDPRGHDFSRDQFVVFKAKDIELARSLLKAYADVVGTLEEGRYKVYDFQRIIAKDIMKPLFGAGFNPIQNPYFTIIEDFVIFANSSQALQSWLDKQIFSQTLGRDAQYLQFISNLAQTTNLYFYANTSTISPILTKYFKEEFDFILGNYFYNLQKFTPLGVQFTPNQQKFFTNAHLEFHQSGRPVSSILWKTELKSPTIIEPTIVKNHQSDEFEIFTQDSSNRIYLLNRNGEILWENDEIDSTIISKIHQIDYYNNTFLQYFFNTKKYLYLIDRNGNHVEGFPRKLKPYASNGMLVVDYFNNKNYRYFLNFEDGAIRGYEKDGRLLEGWDKENIGIASFPMQHFVYREKDYLVALTEDGTLYNFKRNGDNRLDSLDYNTTFPSTFGYDTAQYPRVVATNEEGKAYVANFKGDFFNLSMNVGDNKAVKFAYADIIGDERKDYIVLDNNKLAVYFYNDLAFKRRFRHEFEEEQKELFTVQLNGHQRANIGTVSKDLNRTYLLDSAGQLYPDFPLSGTIPFIVVDLYQDNKSILIGGNGKTIYAYKLKNAP